MIPWHQNRERVAIVGVVHDVHEAQTEIEPSVCPMLDFIHASSDVRYSDVTASSAVF